MRLSAPLAGSLSLAVLLVTGSALPLTAASPVSQSAEVQPLAERSLLIGLARAGDRLVAVGEFGHVLLSDDQGKTWRQAKTVPSRATLTGVSFIDATTGYAVGHDETILKTTDAGETWVRQFGGEDSDNALLSVLVTGPQSAIAVGMFGFALRTGDGGATWETFVLFPDTQDDSHLQKLFPGPDGLLFIAAEFGAVMRSADGGQTWEKIETGYDGSFWGGVTLTSGRVLVVGMRGNIWSSDDAGLTWTKVETGLRDSLSDVTQMPDGSIIAVGLGGAIAVSTDNGSTFLSTNRPDRKGLADVAAGPDGKLVIVGEPGIVVEPLNLTPEG